MAISTNTKPLPFQTAIERRQGFGLPQSGDISTIPTPQSVPELLRAEIPNASSDRKPVRLLLCGTPKGVNRIIDILHVLGFAQIVEWSRPLPSPISGEIMRILTRYFAE